MITARARRARGENVVVFDPMGITSEEPGGFNPLDLIRPDSHEGVDEATALVTALLPDEIAGDKNQYRINRGRQLLLGVILHVVTDLPREKRTHSALGYRPPAPETIVPMEPRPILHLHSNWTIQVGLISGIARVRA